MKRFTLSAQSLRTAFGMVALVCLLQPVTQAQMSIGVNEGNFDRPGAFLFGDEGLPGPTEFMTDPDIRAFGPNGEGEGPSAPFYDQPTYNYTGWYRPRASGRDQSARCYGDTFRPRGYGHLFARQWNGQRMDYKPYVLTNWRSPHGPAYYNLAEDPRCPHCDHQGSCLSSLHQKKCALLGNCPLLSRCNGCGRGGCDECSDGSCDTCNSYGDCDECGNGSYFRGRVRRGWSEWITRPRRGAVGSRFADRRLRRRGGGCDQCAGQGQGCDGSCGSCGAASSGGLMLGAPAGNSSGSNCGCTSCQARNQATQFAPLTSTGATDTTANQAAEESYERPRTAGRNAPVFDNGAGVIN